MGLCRSWPKLGHQEDDPQAWRRDTPLRGHRKAIAVKDAAGIVTHRVLGMVVGVSGGFGLWALFSTPHGTQTAVLHSQLLPLADEEWSRLLELEQKALAIGRFYDQDVPAVPVSDYQI